MSSRLLSDVAVVAFTLACNTTSEVSDAKVVKAS